VLSSSLVQYATIPADYDDSQARYTGYAVANTESEDINIKILTVSQDGKVIDTLSPANLNPLRAGQQTAGFLHEILPAGRSSFKGSMVLTEKNGKTISAVALVSNKGLFTTIAVIPAKAPNIN
jgi:hypothetical protein